jgi:hypothetical protein
MEQNRDSEWQAEKYRSLRSYFSHLIFTTTLWAKNYFLHSKTNKLKVKDSQQLPESCNVDRRWTWDSNFVWLHFPFFKYHITWCALHFFTSVTHKQRCNKMFSISYLASTFLQRLRIRPFCLVLLFFSSKLYRYWAWWQTPVIPTLRRPR